MTPLKEFMAVSPAEIGRRFATRPKPGTTPERETRPKRSEIEKKA